MALKRGAAQELGDLGLILFVWIPLGFWLALVSPRWMWFGPALIIPLLLVDYVAFLQGPG